MANGYILTAAARSIAEGEKERTAAASQLALDFMRHPGRFDPRALGALGEQGLAEFLSRVSRQTPFDDSRDLSLEKVAASSSKAVTADFGWADQRRPEPQWFLDGVGTAIVTGIFLSLLSAIYIRFFGA